jgi:hypothetical protein
VATRPAAPASTAPLAAPQPSAPTIGSVPWAPPTTTPAAPTGSRY